MQKPENWKRASINFSFKNANIKEGSKFILNFQNEKENF